MRLPLSFLLFRNVSPQTTPRIPARRASTLPTFFRHGLTVFVLGSLALPAFSQAEARSVRRIHRTVVQPVRILTFGGAIAAVQQKVLFTPYAHLIQHPLVPSSWDGEIESLRKQETESPRRWAAVMMETSSLQVSCSLGLLVRDPADSSTNSCGQSSASIDFAMAWDRSRFDTPPDWSDFWDVARHPGRRSLRRDPRTTLEIALLADGVAPDALYRVLNTQDGVDRAFRKLDQLRPYIVWWSTPEEAARILKSGGALMGSVPTGEILSATPAERDRFGLYWSQRLEVNYAWGVPKTSAQENTALALTAWLEHSTQKQAFANAWPSLPSLSEINASSPDSRHFLPPIAVNDTFWSAHLPTLSARFAHWAENR
ncbi:extracellular solute-binding protein [Acetobacter orleanensis]|uniref:ABC transporter substrate-binding protein n=1 Tax=Acetobacter orleanensis TaxID=104099 RepID=A0A4Y3TMF8_9PROT|nr:extracellular solute-binding protein [Acetobacter orleanensis]PCD78868.1 spermidine/putrescine ABC transporter substrate-binding protein [Acetobacter orleanensis]GAN69654.1 ABC transporter spermidine/putrescine permease [Acetobacter orleanensis JCM 7639]GBR29199.1 ABC transporter substrate-binding protein [Acetobacter orleanensis NRIC 0473]GEB83536.1 ABC transporter substrate-binding protein [Acetobacter orleanensis]